MCAPGWAATLNLIKVDRLARGVSCFLSSKRSLASLSETSDIVCVSNSSLSTQRDTLRRYLKERKTICFERLKDGVIKRNLIVSTNTTSDVPSVCLILEILDKHFSYGILVVNREGEDGRI